jgi:WD40 repeat protein
MTLKVVAVYEGHFDEITKLAVVGTNIISASLDCTIRVWDTREPPKKLEFQKEEPKKDHVALTEEEERELAELMSDDDE